MTDRGTDADTKPDNVSRNILQSELDFSKVLFKEHPKCYWIWKYRLWVLDQVTDKLRIDVARAIWNEELAFISKILVKDRRNFHAWAFRRHIVTKLESAALLGHSMIESEYDFTTRMIRQDLSNFSAWHNRTQLIPRLLRERKSGDEARRKFLEAELELVRGAINVGPDDQSPWYYHKFLMYNLTDGSSINQVVFSHLPKTDRKSYLLQEISNVQELTDDFADVKWIWEALVEQSLAIFHLDGRPGSIQERADLNLWFQRLEVLDQKRLGRWNYLKNNLGL
ncbi:hypothetical protein CP533_0419 [Ophiocordyceps camponoti-saundersi (nom. inval.)]|nr:hypothetical protein CP533_0419 [Ophiocordyceps camponoti-saundersi (nom. inval.)]